MNKIYVAVAFLIIIPLASFFYIGYITDKGEEIVKEIKLAYEYAQSDESHFENVEKKWEKFEKSLAFSTNHAVIENINESIIKSKEYLKNGRTDMYKVELKWLEKLIKHTGEMEKPGAENIF